MLAKQDLIETRSKLVDLWSDYVCEKANDGQALTAEHVYNGLEAAFEQMRDEIMLKAGQKLLCQQQSKNEIIYQ